MLSEDAGSFTFPKSGDALFNVRFNSERERESKRERERDRERLWNSR